MCMWQWKHITGNYQIKPIKLLHVINETQRYMINLCSKFCTFVVVLLFNINPTVFSITTTVYTGSTIIHVYIILHFMVYQSIVPPFHPFPVFYTPLSVQWYSSMVWWEAGRECAQYNLEWIHIVDKLPQDKSKRFVTSVSSIWQHNN